MKTSRILHIIINYKNNNETESFVKSCIDLATDSTEFIIVNNSAENENSQEFFNLKSSKVAVFQFPDNPGYLGAVQRVSEKIDFKNFDFVIISNSDLKIENLDFYKVLSAISFRPNRVGSLAPSIWSDLYKHESNPLYLLRPTEKKISRLHFIYQNYLLAFCYHLLSSIKHFIFKGDAKKRLSDEFEVYAPHGCFLILTKLFFEVEGSLKFGSRLYGEEVFLAEQLRIRDLKVQTCPSLKITHREKGSEGNSFFRLFLSKQTFEFKRESSAYLKKIFIESKNI